MVHFGDLPDPRAQNRQYPLATVIGLAICGVFCGADTFQDIADWAVRSSPWLDDLLDLSTGIPSHDTIQRVFAMLDPDAFAVRFASWVRSLGAGVPTHIAIDGKTTCGSAWRADKPLHLVSAFASDWGLTLGQIAVDQKSNEITAVPELLKLLYLKGAIVTLDAMGTQKEIAKAIVAAGGTYVLALKQNQRNLYEAVTDTFVATPEEELDQDIWVSKGHGRLERRTASLVSDSEILAWIHQQAPWPHLRAVGQISAERWIQGKHEAATRYYLLSQALSAKAFNQAVRNHWAVENTLHWSMDVTFADDRTLGKNGRENLGRVRQLALNLIALNPCQRANGEYLSVRSRRKCAGWDPVYLQQVLLTRPKALQQTA